MTKYGNKLSEPSPCFFFFFFFFIREFVGVAHILVQKKIWKSPFLALLQFFRANYGLDPDILEWSNGFQKLVQDLYYVYKP